MLQTSSPGLQNLGKMLCMTAHNYLNEFLLCQDENLCGGVPDPFWREFRKTMCLPVILSLALLVKAEKGN